MKIEHVRIQYHLAESDTLLYCVFKNGALLSLKGQCHEFLDPQFPFPFNIYFFSSNYKCVMLTYVLVFAIASL
jgi:hypothetical protein